MGVGKAGGEIVRAGSAQGFVGPPAAGGEALRKKHVESVLCNAKVFFASQSEIRLHGGGKRVDVAVGVAARQVVLALRERVVILVVEILYAERLVTFAGAALVSQKKIFRDGVGLVPGVGDILPRTPNSVVLDGCFGEVRQGDIRGVVEDGKGVRVTDKFVGIDKATNDLVVAVSGKTIFFVEVAGDGLRVKAIQAQDLLANFGGLRDGVAASQRRDPLTECSARGETGAESVIVVVRVVKVPAAQLRAGCGLPGHLAQRFQETILAEAH